MSGEFYNAIEEIVLPQNEEHDQDQDEEEIPSDQLSSLSCELCNVKVTSTKILQRHLEGRKHKMKVERKGKTFECELCDVVANSEIQLNIHLNSTKHKNKVLKKEHTEFTAISANKKGVWILLFCVVCIFINLLLLFRVICH